MPFLFLLVVVGGGPYPVHLTEKAITGKCHLYFGDVDSFTNCRQPCSLQRQRVLFAQSLQPVGATVPAEHVPPPGLHTGDTGHPSSRNRELGRGWRGDVANLDAVFRFLRDGCAAVLNESIFYVTGFPRKPGASEQQTAAQKSARQGTVRPRIHTSDQLEHFFF